MTQDASAHSTIVAAARLHTMQEGARGNALLIAQGRVQRIGALDELRRQAPAARVLDFGSATITPGLTDSHVHITEWAVARRGVDLSRARSPAQAADLIVQGARPRESGWLVGRGWNAHQWGGEYPHRDTLDAVLPQVPAAFQSHDMHGLWANTLALAAAGIDERTPDPPGGRIVRDESGRPTGTLLENAGRLVMQVIPAPSEAEVLAAVLDAQRVLHGYGITGIHSLPGFHLIEPLPLRVLQTLVQQDTLRLRVLQHLALDQLDAAIALGLKSGLGGAWLRIGGIKMFLDGSLGSRTAWMRAPYEGSTNDGVRMMSGREFRAAVQRAAAAGLASTVHGIGDAAVALAFEVLTAPGAQAGTLPNRIEHVQCCPPDVLPLAGRAGIVSSMQPCHLINDWRNANRHWGEARARQTYAFRSLLDHGAVLALGSDAPVEPVDPRLGFHAAVTRTDLEREPAGGWFAEENIDMAAVLAGYTIGPAQAAGAADWQGRLAPGYVADFVVWQDDPLAAAPSELLGLRLLATFVNGQDTGSHE